MDAATISAIAEVVDAIPDGPYIVVESPFPALEQIAGRDINLGSTFGDVNMPFGEDFLDVEVHDDNSTNVSDIVDVNAGNGVIIDSAIEETPEPEAPEIVVDSAIEETPEQEAPEIVVDSAINEDERLWANPNLIDPNDEDNSRFDW